MTISIKEKRRLLGGGVYDVTLTMPQIPLFSLMQMIAGLSYAVGEDDDGSSESDTKIAEYARSIAMFLSVAGCPLGDIATSMNDCLYNGYPLGDGPIKKWAPAGRQLAVITKTLHASINAMEKGDGECLRAMAKRLYMTWAPIPADEFSIVHNIGIRAMHRQREADAEKAQAGNQSAGGGKEAAK